VTQYTCKVGTPGGDIQELAFQSENEHLLRSELVEKGYHIFWVKKSFSLGSLGSLGSAGRQRIKSTEFMIFNQELSALLRSGLPLLQSLDIMLERMKNPLFKRVIADVREKVKAGTSISDAFRSHGDLFPRIYSASLLAGEKSGSLEEVIQRYVRYLKLTEATKNKVIAALIYPVILFMALIGAASFLLLWVVPRFSGFFDGFDTELPLITIVMLGVANTFRANLYIIVPSLLAALALGYVWSRRSGSRVTLDRFKLRLPFLGPVLHLFATSQLFRSLATLLAGGIPLVQSIEVAAASVGNRCIGESVSPVADRVSEGKSFSASLDATGQFSNIAIEMARVGETTGSLSEMLTNVADFADEEIDNRLNIMLAMLTPVVLVLLGGFVAIILLALYLPLFSMAGAARGA
jgi:type IV pilus assembly protein PilC